MKIQTGVKALIKITGTAKEWPKAQKFLRASMYDGPIEPMWWVQNGEKKEFTVRCEKNMIAGDFEI